MRAEWLLALLVATHYLYDWTPHPWATMTAMLGADTAILAWHIRGRRYGPLWWVCLLFAFEGWQMFCCQLMLNWFPDPPTQPFQGVCGAVTGVPLYGVGLGMAALIAGYIGRKRGHRPPDG